MTTNNWMKLETLSHPSTSIPTWIIHSLWLQGTCQVHSILLWTVPKMSKPTCSWGVTLQDNYFSSETQLKHLFTLTSPLITPWETKVPAAASVPLFQLGCHLFARRHAISSVLKAQLQCDKLRCNLSAWLQPVSSAASCQGSRDFSSSAQLQTVSLAATVPTQCAFVNSAAHTQPSCNLPWNLPSSCISSAHLQFVCSLVFCHTVLLSSVVEECHFQWVYCSAMQGWGRVVPQAPFGGLPRPYGPWAFLNHVPFTLNLWSQRITILRCAGNPCEHIWLHMVTETTCLYKIISWWCICCSSSCL